MNAALAAAECSLQGLSVGDALGSWYEFTASAVIERVVRSRELPAVQWHWTDDTAMAWSIVECLRVHQSIEQDLLMQHFAEHYERKRGYGRAMRALISRIRAGASWRTETHTFFNGNGSYGNGGAMRIAPLGAYFADNIERLLQQTQRATEITHAHPEAIAGAQAVALAAAHARLPQHDSVFEAVLAYLSPSIVRERIMLAQTCGATNARDVAMLVGNGTNVSAQDTVPLVLWCANQHIDNYAAAIWETVSAGGDCDTTCAMVGGIVVLRTGVDSIPASWLEQREPLPTNHSRD